MKLIFVCTLNFKFFDNYSKKMVKMNDYKFFLYIINFKYYNIIIFKLIIMIKNISTTYFPWKMVGNVRQRVVLMN